MILIIDNYDSFCYNLYQYISEVALGSGHEIQVKVFRNDQISIQQVRALNPNQIIISPGPLTPLEAGISIELCKTLAGEIPILGVCLGHQSLATAFGGKVIRAKVPVHGKHETINHDGKGVFRGLPNIIQVARYHSLIVEEASLPDCFEVSAKSGQSSEIMSMRHKVFSNLVGLQFHPESILTPTGKEILANFLQLKRVE